MSLFEKVLVKNPKRARFDFSHGNSLGMRFGMLTPSEVRFIVPGDEVAVSMEQIVRLAPMPVPTFVNMKVRHDWFFVPLSMMYTKRAMDLLLGVGASNTRNRARVANWRSYIANFCGLDSPLLPGSIHDYLGYPCPSDLNAGATAGTDIHAFLLNPDQTHYDAIFDYSNGSLGGATKQGEAFPFTIEPLLAYHYIWRDYYRFTGVQVDTVPGTESWLDNHVFAENFINLAITHSDTITFSSLSSIGIPSNLHHAGSGDSPITFHRFLGRPYYAHYKKDMYTSIRYGSKPTVLIPTGTSGTIPNLREASAVQKFVDIISVAGSRYWDKVKAVWGVTPEGMKDERVKFLARYMSFIKVGEVITTATTEDAQTGDYAGRGLLIDGKYIFRRRFSEHGWLMCISSIVPDLHYYGFNRQFWDVNMLDTPIPQFAQVGDQSVQQRELWYDWQGLNNTPVLGDQFRYYAYKSAPNEVHGDFLMKSFEAWTALGKFSYGNNIIDMTKVLPQDWNQVFGFVGNPHIYGNKFFLDLTFHEYITRSLPKYISYSL